MDTSMRWGPAREIPTWLLDRIFDRAGGWDVPQTSAEVSRVLAHDGNVNYNVKIGRITVGVFETHTWDDPARLMNTVSPGRLVARTEFSGITVHDTKALLVDSFTSNGCPSFGFNAAGQPTLQTAFPISGDFPVHLARAQLMVCIGMLALRAESLLTAWTGNASAPARGGPTPSTADGDDAWQTAGQVASVAGRFLGALFS